MISVTPTECMKEIKAHEVGVGAFFSGSVCFLGPLLLVIGSCVFRVCLAFNYVIIADLKISAQEHCADSEESDNFREKCSLEFCPCCYFDL